ncbi:hypothetical protein KJ652_02495 [Patescibacteria group bacterium]|nr:hypothetical protein [Patescibacteria group bacterium]MBU1123436.1 hypothetical protein [Patescibacteria group bacterium]MBU1910887.1 hypothetical protein [Patescibacteria group bacterium]
MRLLGILTGMIVVLLIPSEVLAISLPAGAGCIDGGLLCSADLAGFINTKLSAKGAIAFSGFLFAMLVFYGIRMLFATGDESSLTDIRKSISYAIFGTVMVSGATIISNSFTNSGTFGGVIVNTGALSSGILAPLKTFVVGLAGIALIIMITYQGFRLNLAEDEGQSSAARKRFIEGLIGAAVICLVDPIVDAFIPSSQNMTGLMSQFVGISRFLATIFGGLAVVAIVVGGMMLVVSPNDTMKDRGRQVIVGSIIAIIIVWSSYAIIRTFL